MDAPRLSETRELRFSPGRSRKGTSWFGVRTGHSDRARSVDIRDITSGEYVSPMQGFDPEPYVIRVAAEQSGTVKLGQITRGSWRTGDVRLA